MRNRPGGQKGKQYVHSQSRQVRNYPFRRYPRWKGRRKLRYLRGGLEVRQAVEVSYGTLLHQKEVEKREERSSHFFWIFSFRRITSK